MFETITVLPPAAGAMPDARSTPRPSLPPPDVRIDETLVRRLLSRQGPEFLQEPLVRAGEGWDNVTFRMGIPEAGAAGLAVRLPRRAVAARLLSVERRWLPEVARGFPLPVPLPLLRGRPDAGYPYPWCVVPWITGAPADEARLPATEALVLAEALRILHRPAPVGAPRSPFRGVPLTDRASGVEARLESLGLTDLLPAWRQALVPAGADDGVWIHGDLHARNVIVREGRLAGIIDWGDLTVGDPATDLAAAWTVLPDGEARETFLSAYGASGPARARARGWAVLLACGMADSGDPVHERLGLAIAQRIRGG